LLKAGEREDDTEHSVLNVKKARRWGYDFPYAWAADPACNLFNGAGLPASPFRTDTFDIPIGAPKK